MNLNEKINEYVENVTNTYKTKTTYKDDIVEFMIFLDSRKKTLETPNIFKEYVDYLKNVKNRTDNTIRRKKTVVTRFYLYCYPDDDFDHFQDHIIYYDRRNNLIIKDFSRVEILINKTKK